MGARGPQSVAALEVVANSPVSAIERPQAPDDLTPEQRREWVAIVNRMPADWFPRETHGLLAQYCRHVVAAAHVADLVEKLMAGKLDSDDYVADYDRLLKMQEREGRAMSSLATRMRMSQQSTYEPRRGKGPKNRQLPHQS